MMFMLVSKSSKTVNFDEHNIIKFLKYFEELCDEHEIIAKKRWIKFSQYCERQIIEFMKTLISYVDRN